MVNFSRLPLCSLFMIPCSGTNFSRCPHLAFCLWYLILVVAFRSISVAAQLSFCLWYLVLVSLKVWSISVAAHFAFCLWYLVLVLALRSITVSAHFAFCLWYLALAPALRSISVVAHFASCLWYSRLSLSRITRDSLKYIEISVPRHIRFAELRKK